MFKVGDTVKRKPEFARPFWGDPSLTYTVIAVWAGENATDGRPCIKLDGVRDRWWAERFELAAQPKTLEQIYEET